MTLVPIAPPGGKEERSAAFSHQTASRWSNHAREKSFSNEVDVAGEQRLFPTRPLSLICLLGNTVNNLGSQTVYCTALQLYKCPRLSDDFYGHVAAATGRMSRN